MPHDSEPRARTNQSDRKRRYGLALVAGLLALLGSGRGFSGDYHYGTQMECSDCHTQHNSDSSSGTTQPQRYDNETQPAPILLRAATPLELCLSCHGQGSHDPAAPKVTDPIGYIPESAAGEFQNGGGIPSTISHDLNCAAAIPPGAPAGFPDITLTCTTCHDPHGNANYRNLRTNPAPVPAPEVSVVVKQTVIANGQVNNRDLVYAPANVIYRSGISKWCESCHGEPLAGSDHPVERTIFGATESDGITPLYPNWLATSLPRVPVDNPSDEAIPSADDQVTCLSCHKAHGSHNYKALIYADGATMDSTCQECHNQ